MALNKNKVNQNKADQMLRNMNSTDSSSSDFVNRLSVLEARNEIKNNPEAAAKTSISSTKPEPPMPAAGVLPDILDIPEPATDIPAKTEAVPVISEADKPEPVKREVPQREISKREPAKREPGKRGARTKAERGEECRVQFSTTLPAEMIDRIRAEAKAQYIPFSLFIEKVFVEYFSTH